MRDVNWLESQLFCASRSDSQSKSEISRLRSPSKDTEAMSLIRMALTAKMEAAQETLSTALLTALEFGNNSSSGDDVKPSLTSQPLSTILPRHTGSSGSICFVVRRPG